MASAGAPAVPPNRNRLTNTTEPPDSKGENLSKLMVAIISAVSAIIVAFITSYFQYQIQIAPTKTELEKTRSALGDTSQQLKQVQSNSLGSLEQGQKLCRVLVAKSWRDSVIVPQNWNSKLCDDYAKRLGGKTATYQLGCISSRGTDLGGEDGTLPPNNTCGWN